MASEHSKACSVSLIVQFSSVTQSCPTPCDPMNRSTLGLPVHHQLLEFTQTHVYNARVMYNILGGKKNVTWACPVSLPGRCYLQPHLPFHSHSFCDLMPAPELSFYISSHFFDYKEKILIRLSSDSLQYEWETKSIKQD